MRGDTNQVKHLKKYDDTKSAQLSKPINKEKGIQKPKTRGRPSKALKLLPGQQILTFRPKIIKQADNELKFFCYDQKTMQWPEEFTRKIIHHNVDNDQQSNEYIVRREVDKCVASLVQEIAFKKFMELEETIGFEAVGSK